MSTFRIEPYTLNDAKLRYDAVIESKEHLLPFITWAKGYTLDESKQWILAAVNNFGGTEYSFKILNEHNEYVGEIRIISITTNRYERFASLAYWVRKQHARQGAVTHAIRLAANFAFHELKLYRLQIMILPDNQKSIDTALKAGAKYEGQLRHQWCFDEKMHNVKLFSLLPEDLIDEKPF